MVSQWLPYLVPILVAAFAYFGGRYQSRQTRAATTDTSRQTTLDARDARLYAAAEQLREDQRMEILRVIAERDAAVARADKFQQLLMEALAKAESATTFAEKSAGMPPAGPPA